MSSTSTSISLPFQSTLPRLNNMAFRQVSTPSSIRLPTGCVLGLPARPAASHITGYEPASISQPLHMQRCPHRPAQRSLAH